MSKSERILFYTVIGLFIMGWMGAIPLDAEAFGLQLIWTPIASACAFYLMKFAGIFGRELRREQAAMPQAETRAEAWKRKLEEGERNAREEQPVPVVIKLFDRELNLESSIIIHPDGNIDIEGNPPEDVIKAARDMQDAIQIFGAEAIAHQIQKYINETRNSDNND